MHPVKRTSGAAFQISVAVLLVIAMRLIVAAQTTATIPFHVRESAGIRRTEYPVSAQFTLAKGALKDDSHARLVFNGAEVVAQFTATTLWEDQSVRTLDVDFNASLDPEENRPYQLQYGESVSASSAPTRGLTVEDRPDAVQVGSLRFSKSGSPLLASAAYRGEGVGSGQNGLVITDDLGQRHDLTAATSPRMEILKRGPLYVVLRYSATLPLTSSYNVAVAVTLEMPSSKSWVKMIAVVRDPGRHVRGIGIETPFAFDAYPWLWDFGTDSGTYGVFRAATDAVVLTQSANPAGASGWKIETGPQAQRRAYETSAGTRVKNASGWGHFQDAKAAVAFAVERFGRDAGTYTIALDGHGQASFRWTPGEPASEHRFAVYEHFVGTPVAIGAATNPTAMLNPLAVTIER
jgi:hypothetical protein